MADHPLWGEIELLYRSQFLRFERVARAITQDRDAAAEAVQEGFADALRRSHQYDGSGPLAGWVWRCVVNRARKTRVEQPARGYPESVNGHGPQDEDGVRTFVARLPERQRLVVFLRYYADLDYRSIAEALSLEVGTVSATLNAAHASLRASLEEVSG